MSSHQRITVSIVSHGDHAHVEALLSQLRASHAGRVVHVVVTHNIPCGDVVLGAGAWPFLVTQVHNPTPLGFAENQNRAFVRCRTELFCVLNPDMVGLQPEIWSGLIAALQRPHAGCAYPVLLNTDQSVQDNERELLTPWALVRRRLGKLPRRRIDWVSASFWLMPAEIFRQLGGFDSRYRMYCEDAEFCLRLRLAGYTLERAEACATHVAQRASHRNLRLLGWHVASLFRLWCSRSLWQYARQISLGP